MRRVAPLALLLLAPAAGLAQPVPEGRWRAEERCSGQPPRSFLLSSDGTMLTARAPGPNANSFGAILGFAPLLPGGRFAIDLSAPGTDAKSSYTGRLREDRSVTSDGGRWSGANFTPCRLSVTWVGPLPGAAPRSGPTTAGRPEPIPGAAPRGGSTTAGRPEPIPAPARVPAAGTGLPPCAEDGPAPAAMGPDGVWRPTCIPRGRSVDAPVVAPPPAPAAAPAPAAPPAVSSPAGRSNAEVEALRRELEEERQRREAAERALRLNEALGRQGRN